MIGLSPVGKGTAQEQRAIPYDNLAYPVLIALKDGTGSGFYLNKGNAVYLVTAKHVLFDPATGRLRDVAAKLLSYSKDPSESGHNLITLDLSALQNGGNIKAHPSEDVAVVRIATVTETSGLQSLASGSTVSMSLLSAATAEELTKGGLLVASFNIVRCFDAVLTGNDVMVFGYPTSLGLQQIPQIDTHRPLLRRGIVAGTNPQTRSIILDCPTYFGNSGGPVLELDRESLQETKFYIIGVISQYVPFVSTAGSNTFMMQMASNSGYSIATPMDFVLELVK